MSDNWKLQQNVKVGQDLINLRGDNPDEFKAVLEWAVENAALFVNVQAALNAVEKVPALAGNVTSTQVQQEQQGGWGGQQQQAAPSFANPASAAPSCRHGERVFREGKSAKGPWKAYFCPSRDRNDQCDAQWVK